MIEFADVSLVHECRLDEPLAVVEHAVHLDGGDVLSERRELALLYGADFSFGVEHIDMDSVDSEKSVGNCRAGVSRSGDEHVGCLCFVSFLLYE